MRELGRNPGRIISAVQGMIESHDGRLLHYVAAWGFSASFVVMAISGLVAGALILLGIKATGRSLETATAE
jgi:hypothetical protein